MASRPERRRPRQRRERRRPAPRRRVRPTRRPPSPPPRGPAPNNSGSLESRGRQPIFGCGASPVRRRSSPHETFLKHFVLDTNILIHDPGALFHFGDNEVVVPIFVLEEFDQFKKEASERGRNARELARMLDRLRSNGGHLAEGAVLPHGGRLRGATTEGTGPRTLRERPAAAYL